MDDADVFTESDLAYFEHRGRELDKAQATIEADYAKFAGPTGAWVALRNGALVARADSASRLEQALKENSIAVDDVIVRYLPPTGARLVY